MIGEITNTEDIINVCDITERHEELESDDSRDEYDEAEFKILHELLEELRGAGGDHQYKGDWYPGTLIHDSYFVEYAEELCKDIGAVPYDVPWWVEIDWASTAENVQQDYSEIDFDGEKFWYR